MFTEKELEFIKIALICFASDIEMELELFSEDTELITNQYQTLHEAEKLIKKLRNI